MPPALGHPHPYPHQRNFPPQMQGSIVSKYPVTCYIVEPTGHHLLVGTEKGGIEIWNVSGSRKHKHQCQPPKLRQSLSFPMRLKDLTEKMIAMQEKEMHNADRSLTASPTCGDSGNGNVTYSKIANEETCCSESDTSL